MNVLHVVGTLGLGGVQAYLLDLSKYDKQYGISRNLLSLHGNEGTLKEKFLVNGVNCYACDIMSQDYGLRPYRLWKGIRKFIRSLFFIKLFRVIRRLQPDIIVCEEPSNLNTQLFVSRILRIPIIWHIHNEHQFVNVNKTIFNWTFEYIFKNNLSIISDSKYILNKNLLEFKMKMNGQWDSIPILSSTSDLTNMINNSSEKSDNKNQIQLGSIGRLTWQKNFELLIHVFAKMTKQTKKEIHLFIAGIGPMHGRLTKLIQELKLEKYVTLVGNVEREDIPDFLSRLDIYIQSSVSEGSPLTIKEAMAASLPILSTSVGGIPEMIINRKTGFLVPHDDKNGFTRALSELINMDESVRNKIGENANRYAMKNFSIESLAKNHSDLYKKLYNKKPCR